MHMLRLVIALPFLVALTGCSATAKRTNMIMMNESMEPLRERFNAEKDRSRIVALFSPV